MRQELSDKLSGLKNKSRSVLTKALGLGISAYLLLKLGDHNGLLDSARTVEAEKNHNNTNAIKTVAEVEEEWEDNSDWALISSAFGGGGYNPLVIRIVTFKDGSQAYLRYRTLAWQPLRKWVKGEEFNPKPGERYEVTSENRIVRRL